MDLPQVYMCSPSWTLLPPPSPYHPSGSSQCTSPRHPVSCIEPGLATRFIHDIIHVSMPFSQIFPPSPSPTESIRLFYTSLSLLLSRTQGYCYQMYSFNWKVLSEWRFYKFCIIQWMLAIWCLVHLPLQISGYIPGISQFTYCWNLAWRILVITLLACEMRAVVQ